MPTDNYSQATRKAKHWTESAIRKLKPVDRDTMHGIGDCLYLRQSPRGKLTWIYRTKTDGQTIKRNLGTFPLVTLTQAKAEAAKLNTRTLPVNTSVAAVAQQWYENVIEPVYKATRNVQVYVRRLEREFGNRVIQQITTADLVASLGRYGKMHPVAANRCRSNWSLVFDYARECGLIEHNPLSGTTSRIAGGREKTRDRILTDDEIRDLWHDPHAHTPLLRFLLLTGLRISEAQGAIVENLNSNHVLAIPENKSSRPHWVYLPELAREQTGDFIGYLFNPLSPTAVQARLKRADKGWTPHDLRRTFATRLAEIGCPIHVIEKMLNHSMQGVASVYNRHDYQPERIEWANKWADALAVIVQSEAV